MITGNEPAMPKMAGSAHEGLTIRQHFAAMAMQDLMANTEKTPMTDKELCEFSVRISDTLITELNKEK